MPFHFANQTRPQVSVTLAALSVLSLVMTTGCGVLDSGANLPTIAFTRFDQSTYRSQDDSRDLTPAANRRLSFDEMLNSTESSTLPEASPRVEAPAVFGNSDQNISPAFGHSTGHVSVPAGSGSQQSNKPPVRFSADAIRRIMNQQSSNDMSEGRVLSDVPVELNTRIISEPNNQPTQDPRSTRNESNIPDISEASVDSTVKSVSSSSELTEPVQDVESPPAVVPSEPTMLGRLKELYDPVEENSREFLRRPFQRIPSPWSLLREREQEESAQQVAEPELPVTASVEESAVEIPADTVRQMLSELIIQTEQQLSEWPRQFNGQPENPDGYRRRQMDLRMLYLMMDKPASAMAAIDSLPASEQEFWQELMLGISQFRSPSLEVEVEQHRAGTVSQIRAAVRHLQQSSMLTIRRMEFCSRINSFGSVENFPTNDFDPGQPVLMYVEIDNFGTEIGRDGNYRTAFSAKLEFYHDGSDEPIESIDVPGIDDSSSSLRNDFFHSFELTIPSHFATGRYQLRLKLRDQISQRDASSTVEFQVR